MYLGLVVCLGFLLGAPWVLGTLPGNESQPRQLRSNIASFLFSQHDIVVRPSEMVLPGRGKVEQASGGLVPTEVYFLGRRRGAGNRDLFFAHIIHSSAAVPVHSSPVFSLSRTRSADEAQLSYDSRRYLAYASMIEGKASVITVLDLNGLSREATEAFSATERLQQRLTNWQDTGRWRGLDRLEVRLPLPQAVRLRWTDEGLVIRQQQGRWEAVVDPVATRVRRGPARIRRVRVGQRAFIPWAVDTVRSFSFVGPDRIAWLEQQVYGLVDQARRMSGAEVTVTEIQDEMALPLVTGAGQNKIEGWPPPPLPTILKKTLPGEGKWTEVKGPFVRGEKGEPALFAMSFVRPDAERLFARVYFVAWDPRRVELRMTAGTREPRPSTGFRGSGMIPRRPGVLGRLVAAFNGGFQSVHGDYGMMLDRKLVIPAKPWAATVARLADGSTAMGTWDGAARYGWTPPWIHSFRQNLTALVEHDRPNPWRRGSWGGALATAKTGPEFRVLRSGLCLHRTGHMMYVQGVPLDGQMMGATMHAVGCVYGMMLDINTSHVGFEFYNVRLPGEAPQHDARTFKPQKLLSARGKYPRLKGYRYTMRAATRSAYNRCPRWVSREARDFFYLVRRDPLTGGDLRPLGDAKNEGRWTVATLPAAALTFPQTMARAFLQPAPKRRVHLVALDMRWLEARICLPRKDRDCLHDASVDDVLAVLPLGRFHRTRALWANGKALLGEGGRRRHVTLKPLRPGGPALPSVSQKPDSDREAVSIEAAAPDSAGQVQAALGVLESGRLLYATSLGQRTDLLQEALARAGCKEMISLGSVEPMVFRTGKAWRSVHGDAFPPVASSPSLILRRSRASWGTRIFSHVKVQPRRVWLAVQPERTRSVQLRRANRVIKRLGLPPIRSLRALCRQPYEEVEELRQHRWRDPVTKRWICGGKSRRTRKNRK